MSQYYQCSTDDCHKRSEVELMRCPACKGWNTFVFLEDERLAAHMARSTEPTPVTQIETVGYLRLPTGILELDRVLGGGIVAGSLIALGGNPGAGKSTLALQVSKAFAQAGHSTLYAGGEESVQQVRMRAKRIDSMSSSLLIVAETNLERILEHAQKKPPGLLIIDSINTTWTTDRGFEPGSIATARAVISRLLEFSKQQTNIPILLISHVTKEGTLAGPKSLEHMVDAVLFLDNERGEEVRTLSASKNRFGSVEELGFFRMTETGLVDDMPEFLNPEETPPPGHAIGITKTGSRLLFVEIQSLVCPCDEPHPKRVAQGIDGKRFSLLLGILAKAGMDLSRDDVYLEVSGGIPLKDRLSDLAILMSLVSGYLGIQLGLSVGIGEVNITGMVRSQGVTDPILQELARHPFDAMLMPSGSKRIVKGGNADAFVGIRLVEGLIDWIRKMGG